MGHRHFVPMASLHPASSAALASDTSITPNLAIGMQKSLPRSALARLDRPDTRSNFLGAGHLHLDFYNSSVRHA